MILDIVIVAASAEDQPTRARDDTVDLATMIAPNGPPRVRGDDLESHTGGSPALDDSEEM